MRRNTKFLLITIGTVVILLISCTLFYFNDGTLQQADYSGGLSAVVRQGFGLAERNHDPVTLRDIGRLLEHEWKVLSKDEELMFRLRKNRTVIINNDTIGIDGVRKSVQSASVKEVVNSNVSVKGRIGLLDVDKAVKGSEMGDNVRQKKALYENNPFKSSNGKGDGRDVINYGEFNADFVGGDIVEDREKDSQFDAKEKQEDNHLLVNRSLSLNPHSVRSHEDNNLLKEHYSFIDRYRLTHPCSDPLCTELLSERDMANFTTCKRRTEATYKKMVAKYPHLSSSSTSSLPGPWGTSKLAARVSNGQLQASGECRFMNGSGRSPVGLVSFPGSGNTWVRGLLQKVTGICTGAVYCDRTLRMGGFDGEGVQSGSVLLVKTHSSNPMWSKVKGRLEYGLKGRPYFDSTVLVVRNPFDALVSEWNLELSTKFGLGKGNRSAHTNTYGQEYFMTYSYWTKFVEERIKKWRLHFDWLFKSPNDHDIIMVRYEDLKSDMVHQMERILRFLHFPYIYGKLSAQLSQDFAVFHRTSKKSFDHFTKKQKELVNTVIQSVSQQLYEALGSTYDIEEYIMIK